MTLEAARVREASRRVRYLEVRLSEDEATNVQIIDATLAEEARTLVVVTEVTKEDLFKRGVHWLPDEEAADCMAVTYLLCKQLLERGNYQDWTTDEIYKAVEKVCLPGPGGDNPRIEVTLSPLIND